MKSNLNTLKKLCSEYDDLDKYENHFMVFYCKKDTDILHNPHGPAVILIKSIEKIYQYYLNGVLHTKHQFNKIKNI